MLKRCVMLAALTISTSIGASDNDLDYTCVDSGTRYRIALVRKVPGQALPCSVQAFEHPLGRYSINWRVLWTAANQEGFCEAKIRELVERRRRDGWKCVLSEGWRGWSLRNR